jgi:hypothetical protein
MALPKAESARADRGQNGDLALRYVSVFRVNQPDGLNLRRRIVSELDLTAHAHGVPWALLISDDVRPLELPR